MALLQMQQRLKKLERTVRTLKDANRPATLRDWFIAAAGRFQNDPAFDQIIALGRRYRASLDKNGKRRRGPS